VNLGFGVAVLDLLPQVALLVGDFNQEFCHFLPCRSAFHVCFSECYVPSLTPCLQSPYRFLTHQLVPK
jgi:hypothetical protein